MTLSPMEKQKTVLRRFAIETALNRHAHQIQTSTWFTLVERAQGEQQLNLKREQQENSGKTKWNLCGNNRKKAERARLGELRENWERTLGEKQEFWKNRRRTLGEQKINNIGTAVKLWENSRRTLKEWNKNSVENKMELYENSRRILGRWELCEQQANTGFLHSVKTD